MLIEKPMTLSIKDAEEISCVSREGKSKCNGWTCSFVPSCFNENKKYD